MNLNRTLGGNKGLRVGQCNPQRLVAQCLPALLFDIENFYIGAGRLPEITYTHHQLHVINLQSLAGNGKIKLKSQIPRLNIIAPCVLKVILSFESQQFLLNHPRGKRHLTPGYQIHRQRRYQHGRLIEAAGLPVPLYRQLARFGRITDKHQRAGAQVAPPGRGLQQLLRYLPLLLVPPAVGVMVYAKDIAADFWAIVGALVLSLVIAMGFVGVLMQQMVKRKEKDQ